LFEMPMRVQRDVIKMKDVVWRGLMRKELMAE
jgi:hypothetical protein